MASYNLPEMVPRTGNRQRIITLPGIEITNALTRKLERINRRVMQPWISRRERINEIYVAELARRMQLDRSDPLSDLFGQLSIEVDRLLDDLEIDAESWAAEVEAWHREKWRRAVLTGTGLDISYLVGPAEAQESIGDFINRNTALIRNVSDETRRKVADIVYRGFQERTGSRDVAREISRQIGISRRRALRIATDQANKLSGTLDRQRQREAGIEFWKWRHSGKRHFRPEHKARNGKIYTDKNAPQDLPGQLPYCGCVREAVIITDEAEAERIRNRPRGEPAPGNPAATTVPDPVPEPEPVPDPEPSGTFSAINPAVTAESITVGKRLAIARELSAGFKKSARDPRYEETEFRGRNDKDIGKASLGTGFSDPAASMLAALKPELDAMADRLNIPRIRGFKTVSGGAHANMGDGIMGVNGSAFNGYAIGGGVGGRGPGNAGLLGKLQDEFDALDAPMAGLAQRANALKVEIDAAKAAGNAALAESLTIQRYDLLKEWYELDRKRGRIYTKLKRERANLRTAEQDASDWKPGDDLKSRPWFSPDYFEGIDKARAVLFHEFGHHVHQYLGRQGPRRRFGKPPLERDLTLHFRQSNRNRMLSQYGKSNPHEWFAENFAAYAMGRLDLIEPDALGLLERIFDGSYLSNLG